MDYIYEKKNGSQEPLWTVPLMCCVGVLDLDLGELPPQADQLHVAAKYLGDHVAELRTVHTQSLPNRTLCC